MKTVPVLSKHEIRNTQDTVYVCVDVSCDPKLDLWLFPQMGFWLKFFLYQKDN